MSELQIGKIDIDEYPPREQYEKILKQVKEGLSNIRSLTNSWVIAEQTINCKHTYREIERKVNELVRLIITETNL